MKLMSINEAAAAGIERLRDPIWAIPEDHLKIDIFNGKAGLWAHIYSPFNLECNGKDPVDILSLYIDREQQIYVKYDGPISDSHEYKSSQSKFSGCLKHENTNSKTD